MRTSSVDYVFKVALLNIANIFLHHKAKVDSFQLKTQSGFV